MALDPPGGEMPGPIPEPARPHSHAPGPATAPGHPHSHGPGPATAPGHPRGHPGEGDTLAAPSAYVAAPYRPAVQVGVRIALWLAVAVGGVGGIVALVGLSRGEAEAVAEAPAEGADAAASVPAPVAGTAELAVGEWLTATPDDEELLDALFVEPVTLPEAVEGTDLDVLAITTVAGHPIQDGYWVVTLRADIVESVEGQAQPPATWFVEVGVVGDVDGGLRALSTPGVMPAPPAATDGWQSARPTLQPPDEDDPVAATVEAFLDALLAGQAEPAPYLAPDADVPLSAQPPFADVTVAGIAVEEREGGDLQVWVDVAATLPGGREHLVAYELVATPRADRWEIAALWGAPTLESTPGDAG